MKRPPKTAVRRGAERAAVALGSALLRHPDNERLRADIASGALSAQAFYSEVVRLLYRLVFSGAASALGAAPGSIALAERELLLPPDRSVGAGPGSRPPLEGATLDEGARLRALSDLESAAPPGAPRGRQPPALGADELGTIHERLLEMHARIDQDARELTLHAAAGSDRKTTGAYYTAAPLVERLLALTLDPALDEAAALGEGAEAAILNLRICDPACGSGRFLVAAARRTAARLARVRRGGAEPSEADLARAKTDVIASSCYGVDVSQAAVDLCKIALWLEILRAGAPGAAAPELPALSPRIRRGNALIGATPGLLAAGVVDEAFRPLRGDNADVARRLRAKNQAERAAGSVHRARALEGARSEDRLFEADAYCASLFWPLAPGQDEEGAITFHRLRRIAEDPASAPSFTRAQVALIAAKYSFFHWHLAFPEVFSPGGGFDVIVGNPPWGRVTLSDEEFFAQRSVDVARVKGKSARDAAIGALLQSDERLYAAYESAKRDEEASARFYSRSVGAFPLTGWKEVNTYHLFAELCERLLAPRGRAGLFVKTGIASSENCLPLFTKLCRERRLGCLFDFVNTKRLFPGVQAVERFSMITFRGPDGGGGPARFASLCADAADLDEPGRVYELSAGDIALMSPRTLACPLLRGERDAEIMRRLYRSFPVLGDRDLARLDERWNAEHTAIVHLSEDSSAFQTLEGLAAAGAAPLGGGRFSLGGEEYWPLYEGKYLYLLDHRYGTFDAAPAAARFGRKAEARSPTLTELADPTYEITPRYWYPRRLWLNRATKRGLRTDIHFVYRDITGVYPDLRTAIGAITAAGPAGNSAPCITLAGVNGRQSALRLLAFAALFCSIPFDYIVRNRLFSKHINPNVLGELVMPPPRLAVPEPGERGTLRARLCEAALELSYTSASLRPLGEAMGVAAPARFDPTRRFERLREIDAIAAHLYGFSRDELAHALASFETLGASEQRSLGERRTARAVLEGYDRIERDGTRELYGGGAP